MNLGMHSNVMLRFMVQAFQDPPLCSRTILTSCTRTVQYFFNHGVVCVPRTCCSFLFPTVPVVLNGKILEEPHTLLLSSYLGPIPLPLPDVTLTSLPLS
jgi:hypothetical protein